MKRMATAARMFFLAAVLAGAGCEPGREPPAPSNGDGPNPLLAYASYAAVKIDIMPLTEFVSTGSSEDASRLRAYVSVLDEFDCQTKSPGRFRFELYEAVERSPEPKGKRLMIWPDIDLADPAENNSYWRDYLRAYQFNLGFTPVKNGRYILECTCFCPNSKRLSADLMLKYVLK